MLLVCSCSCLHGLKQYYLLSTYMKFKPLLFNTVLEASYKKATDIVLEYLQKENIFDTSAFYKRAESYEKIVSWYEIKRRTEETCE